MNPRPPSPPDGSADAPAPVLRQLPPDDAQRLALHNEVHARPSARIRLPACITYVAVLHNATSRAAQAQHLARLPGHAALCEADLADHFLRLKLPGASLRWERHTEFSRYWLVQPLPVQGNWPSVPALPALPLPENWLAELPGHTLVAIRLVMLHASLDDASALMARAQSWFGEQTLVASVMGSSSASEPWAGHDRHGYAHPLGHSWALSQLRIASDGFEPMLVLAPEGTSATRAGRIAARLLELETYRLMALRGLPLAKALSPELAQAEAELAELTAQLDAKTLADAPLLDQLVGLAARVERATAAHAYRFAATQAYHTLVQQRIAELRERAIPGTQTLGEFMRRRLNPAIATVAATAQRLESLSRRIARTSDLLRTRVDIVTEQQNQQLLERLAQGQSTQLRLQSTVEGLSIAAISYYVVSLLLYAGKALKNLGLPLNPELAAGGAIPLVLWAVWRITQRIHARLNH